MSFVIATPEIVTAAAAAALGVTAGLAARAACWAAWAVPATVGPRVVAAPAIPVSPAIRVRTVRAASQVPPADGFESIWQLGQRARVSG